MVCAVCRGEVESELLIGVCGVPGCVVCREEGV